MTFVSIIAHRNWIPNSDDPGNDLEIHTEDNPMSRTNTKFAVAVLLSAVLAMLAQQSEAATTYVVGTCKSGKQFSTIQSALSATPAPTLVQVCPGNYPEQITITNPVTIQGVAANNSAQAQLKSPTTGFTQNAFIGTMAVGAQILVEDVTGQVNISNLYLNGSNNGLNSAIPVGMYYEYSSGTVNHVAIFNEQGSIGGYGMYILGGHSNQSVTVENSVISYSYSASLVADNLPDGTQLNTTIKGNYIHEAAEHIVVKPGAKATITSNLLYGANTNIDYQGAPGSIASNTILGEYGGYGANQSGIGINSSGVSVASNKIYAMPLDGIVVGDNVTLGPIQGNQLVNSMMHGINLNCTSTGSQVHSNTFLDTLFGFWNPLQGSFRGANTYNVVVQEIGAVCAE
jgi:hypothetical protein